MVIQKQKGGVFDFRRIESAPGNKRQHETGENAVLKYGSGIKERLYRKYKENQSGHEDTFGKAQNYSQKMIHRAEPDSVNNIVKETFQNFYRDKYNEKNGDEGKYPRNKIQIRHETLTDKNGPVFVKEKSGKKPQNHRGHGEKFPDKAADPAADGKDDYQG
jgi:hypothetical protein